ncbi:MAG TPA: histidine phosphatase family protein [Candidatus Sulfotelmatobacter sp.]|nr:histidine phosphatase family protein [Candidatus Sulfotelmatobacter sp.]
MSKKKKNVITIYVIRHGESESNVYAHENPNKPASHFGELGSSLTPKGREQAQKIVQRLKKINFTAIFSSDLLRAKETAEIIAPHYHLPIITIHTIRERFFGEHMSKKQKWKIEKSLEKLNEKEKFAFKYFPHGESGQDVAKRFKKFLNEIIPSYSNKNILVVSHGYVMRSFLINEKFAKYDELKGGTIKNGGYFVIETDGKKYQIISQYGITRNRGYDNEE